MGGRISFMSHLMYRITKSKKGISTILGTLIFVGILITSIFPTYLYVNDVNSYYNRVTTNLSRSDQDRGRENLEVYAYPVIFENDTAKLNIYIRNRSTLTTNIVRIWVNDTNPSIWCLPLSILGTSDYTIEDVSNPSAGDFDVWIATDKGNVFASLTNTIHIEGGSWSGGNPPYLLNVVIHKKTGIRTYQINVTTDPLTSTTISSTGEYILTLFQIGYAPGTFDVIVKRGTLVLYNQSVVLTPQNPSPWITVDDP